MKENNIAIILARSGSKGLKNKNILPLEGKPLLAYSIEAAVKSNLFAKVMVSTDSTVYAEIATKYGAEVPFLRSNNTSNDTASSWDAVKEVLDEYKKRGELFNTVALLQPTSPLRTVEDLKEAYSLLGSKKANAVISVCQTEHSPLWCNTLPETMSMKSFLSKTHNTPRQKLDIYYRLNGAIYLVDYNFFMQHQDVYSGECYAYVMPTYRSIDIDTQLDFKMAEVILKDMRQKGEIC